MDQWHLPIAQWHPFLEVATEFLVDATYPSASDTDPLADAIDSRELSLQP